jgi:hypothetical protein
LQNNQGQHLGAKLMGTNKTQAVLFMYDVLLKDGHLNKADFLSKVDASDITFKRYVSELRCYFSNFALPYDIHYSKRDGLYFLVKVKSN